ncbi:unknown; predicted coding region [Mycoplasmopsis pulmonis]|uniref:Uncharacterized protein n=1 Tax=Mycoplasmopsis pulmonis (strain UAB CTIP) TaxID=272635 RepID=Q98RD4_MYCPU|nr:unknown; predicted coding region [Mycoplasmopsis pulmonis]
MAHHPTKLVLKGFVKSKYLDRIIFNLLAKDFFWYFLLLLNLIATFYLLYF